MALVPLMQWFCDRCGGVIAKPKDGWVHWRRDKERNVYDIEIVHHLLASPRGGEHGCYSARPECDMHLDQMLGPSGIVHLLRMMDIGAHHDGEGRHVGKVKDVRNWVEVFRRLHVPYYEEARLYFDRARSDGDLEGMNEVALYTERVLKRLVEDYGDQAGDDE